MPHKFEKSLLLCPPQYSLNGTFKEILNILSDELHELDIRQFAGPADINIHTQIFRFPFSVRNRWESYFMNKLNEGFKDYFRKLMPDLVMVYNSEFLTPESCELIKQSSKLIFFLGDSPFYTTGNNNYLSILKYANLILTPDTFWAQQLNTIGLTNTRYFAPCINNAQYFEIEETKIEKDIPSCEILYSGMSYVNSWGYKKALFMNQFTEYDLRIYGSKHWKKWFRDFPALRDKYIESGYIPIERLNAMMNRSKLIPVDGNPGILNGFHLRLLEALGSGALPVVEYRTDVENELFRGCGSIAPLVRDYRKAGEIAGYYLKNENERKELSRTLKDHVNSQYSPEKNSERILSWLSDR